MADQNKFELIAKLRERTGAGMMDCKRALEENDYDLEKATATLKKKAAAQVAKKADRIATEGLALPYFSNNKNQVLILELNCETDFVSRGEPFKQLIDQLGGLFLKQLPKTLVEAKTLAAPLLSEATLKIGEKIDVRRFHFLTLSKNQYFGTYVHTNSGLYGTLTALVVLEGGSQVLADNLAMHISSNAPIYISLNDVPKDVVLKEKTAQTDAIKLDPKNASKPQAIIEKIIEGKVNRLFAETTLAEQTYLLSESNALVKTVLGEAKATVKHMVRYKVGEGLEKRVDNFAEEVLSVAKNTH
jgi:elongation factor Ts